MEDREGRERSSAGYVDVHVHLRDPSGLAVVSQAGVVAVRDAGTSDGVGLGLAKARGAGTSVVVRSAGKALCKTGGYGARLGSAASSREEVRAQILSLAESGADIIKLIASGVVSLKHPRTITAGGFDGDDIRFIVDEAATHGLPVMAHANGEAAIRSAAEAGVRSVEHGFFMTDAALESLEKRNIFWVPTVGALRRAAQGAGNPAFIEEEIERHLRMIEKAFRAGVPLAVGTDCVLPDRRYRGCYEEELILFRRAGIPAVSVERIATDGGRRLLGI